MKKLFCILLALAMVLSLAACGSSSSDTSTLPWGEASSQAASASAEAPEAAAPEAEVEAAPEVTVAGLYLIYEASEATHDEIALLEDLADACYSYIQLNEDGTGTMYMFESELQPITWDENCLTADGESVPYTLDGDVFVLDLSEVDSGTMTYHRTDKSVDELSVITSYEEPDESEDNTSLIVEPDAGEDAAPAPVVSTEGVLAEGAIGDYYIAVIGAETFMDSDDKEALRLYYEFTNNSDDLEYAATLDILAEQQGYEMNSTYAHWDEEVEEDDNDWKYVEPGITIRCVEEVSCHFDGGPVTFTISDWLSDDALTVEIDPAACPGRPAEEFAYTTLDTFFVGDMSDAGTYKTDYEISIDSAEVVEDYNGEDAIRVYFTFTNNSEEDESFWMATSTYALQNGIECSTSWVNSEPESDELYDTDIAPGETVQVSKVFNIRNREPVEIIIYDWAGGSLGCVFEFTEE